jgi:hypothetical protein
MDRRSFINQNSFDTTRRCNSEVCECNENFLEKGQLESIKPFHLVVITILAFTTAVAIFSIVKSDTIKGEVIDERNQNVISCSPNEEILNDDRRPVDGNNGNSCPHQVGAVGILYLNNSNHRKNHVC